jgi:hypothetical protein
MEGGSTSEINSLDLKLGKFHWMVSILRHTKSLAAIIVLTIVCFIAGSVAQSLNCSLVHFFTSNLDQTFGGHFLQLAKFGHLPNRPLPSDFNSAPGLSVH